MDLFLAIFGHLISFYYRCFDRIVIHAYLTCFLNPANVIIFFRKNLGHPQITKEVLSAKTNSYKKWLDDFISNNRIIRLMEALLHSGSSISNWRSKELHRYLLQKFGLNPENYTLNQLRYDLRKLRAHGLIERIGVSYRYRLTDYGIKNSLTMVLFHNKIYGPIAGSLFIFKPDQSTDTVSELEKTYRKIDRDIDHLISLMAA